MIEDIKEGRIDFLHTSFGKLVFPFKAAAKIISNSTTRDVKSEDYRWRIEDMQKVRDNIKLDPENTGSTLAEVGDHLLVRKPAKSGIYIQCIGCMKDRIVVGPDDQKALYGFFIETDCDVNSDQIEKLKLIRDGV